MQEDDLRNTTAKFPDRADMLADAFTYAAQQLKIRYPNLQFGLPDGIPQNTCLPMPRSNTWSHGHI